MKKRDTNRYNVATKSTAIGLIFMITHSTNMRCNTVTKMRLHRAPACAQLKSEWVESGFRVGKKK